MKNDPSSIALFFFVVHLGRRPIDRILKSKGSTRCGHNSLSWSFCHRVASGDDGFNWFGYSVVLQVWLSEVKGSQSE